MSGRISSGCWCAAGKLARLMPQAKVFSMPDRERVAKMLRDELADAKVPHRDDSRRIVDFHALRHTFVTLLATSRVHPKTAQALGQHSTITLTMDHYTHSFLGDEMAALAGLPDLDSPAELRAAATGTDAHSDLAPHLAEQHGSEGSSEARESTRVVQLPCSGSHERPSISLEASHPFVVPGTRVARDGFGTRGRARTFDLMIKSHLLYQLSYAGAFGKRGGEDSNSVEPGKRVSAEGIEPSTYWLKASCSAD